MSLIKESINHSTLKSRDPDAFTLITSGHPITFKHQSGAGAELHEPSSPYFFLWNVFPCLVGVRNCVCIT